MAILLPPKVYKTIAPVIEGQVGVPRSVRFSKLINVFVSHFGCQVEGRKGDGVKISPPVLGQGLWMWQRKSIILHKPVNGCLKREDLSRIRKVLQNAYQWDDQTFALGA